MELHAKKRQYGQEKMHTVFPVAKTYTAGREGEGEKEGGGHCKSQWGGSGRQLFYVAYTARASNEEVTFELRPE